MHNFEKITKKIVARLKELEANEKFMKRIPTVLSCIGAGIAVVSALTQPVQVKQPDSNVTIIYNNYSKEDSNEKNS